MRFTILGTADKRAFDGARADLRHTPLTLHLLIEDTE